MTTRQTTTADLAAHGSADTAAAKKETELVAWAASLGRQIAPYASRHDRDGTFVHEAYELLRSSGYLALAVPTELGGHGATIRQTALAQRELARHCASTALASAMHHDVVLFTGWRYRRDMLGAEATLRRIAEEGIVLVSTGGADFTFTARNRSGCRWRLPGQRAQGLRQPGRRRRRLLDDVRLRRQRRRAARADMAVPVRADGVRIIETWDSLGMRSTRSHDVEFTDVFVPTQRKVPLRGAPVGWMRR